MTRVLVTAESFGYGPIVTCLNIMRRLRERLKGHYIFLGSGVSLEQAVCSGLFDEYRECDTFSRPCLEDCRELFTGADFLLSSENMEGAIYGVTLGTKVFYVDNLFWMWDELPEELYQVDKYFIAESLDISENLKRLGPKLSNPMIVGPLRNYHQALAEETPENRVLINFGGAESFLIDQKTITQYYLKLVELIFSGLEGLDAEQIIVCGGSKLIHSLGAYFGEKPKVLFRSLSNQEYLETLLTSRYVIMSPGLGNFFEALSLKHDVLFIPPINYSQYWQLEAYRRIGIGFKVNNWNDFPWFIPVEKYAKEEDGVNQVLANVNLFLTHKPSQESLAKNIANYMAGGSCENFQEARRRHFIGYKKDGIGSIVDEIMNRGGKI